MRKQMRIVGLTVGLIFLLLLATKVVGPGLGTLYSCESMDPTIDGYLDPSEWKDGIPKEVKLHN
ncbi:MAG: hypothetical protein ACTSQX_15530, partial [Candidatus Heimdallarchaeota archaeon]